LSLEIAGSIPARNFFWKKIRLFLSEGKTKYFLNFFFFFHKKIFFFLTKKFFFFFSKKFFFFFIKFFFFSQKNFFHKFFFFFSRTYPSRTREAFDIDFYWEINTVASVVV